MRSMCMLDVEASGNPDLCRAISAQDTIDYSQTQEQLHLNRSRRELGGQDKKLKDIRRQSSIVLKRKKKDLSLPHLPEFV